MSTDDDRDLDLDRDLADLARRLDRDLDPTAADRVLVGLLARDPARRIGSTATVTLVPAPSDDRHRRRRPLLVAAAAAAAVLLVGGVATVVHESTRGDRGSAPAAPVASASPSASPTGHGRVLEVDPADIAADPTALNARIAAQGFRVAFLPSPSVRFTADAEWTCDDPRPEAPYQKDVFGPVSQDNAAPLVLYPDLIAPDVYLVYGVPRDGGGGGIMTIDFVEGPLPSCIY